MNNVHKVLSVGSTWPQSVTYKLSIYICKMHSDYCTYTREILGDFHISFAEMLYRIQHASVKPQKWPSRQRFSWPSSAFKKFWEGSQFPYRTFMLLRQPSLFIFFKITPPSHTLKSATFSFQVMFFSIYQKYKVLLSVSNITIYLRFCITSIRRTRN